ncbi:MAG TPA: polyphosphate kinase 1 [Terriglobales bacterium]|nr:polyphosphate kinase 1 [Terriglobales bacterium]
MVRSPLENPSYYIGRELSWLKFNGRVLEEAFDESNPLLERVKFLAITANNLDEFFEIRVSSLLQRLEDGYTDPGIDGMTPADELEQIAEETHRFVRAQYRCWNEKLRPALSDNGIRILRLSELDDETLEYAQDYCDRELDPLLTPVTVDPAHPFPRVINKALCQALLLKRRRRSSSTYIGVVTVPRSLPRFVRLPKRGFTDDFIGLADLVELHSARMYRGYEIISEGAFRVTRNSNLYLQEEEARSLLESVRTELSNRRKGDAVRLEIESEANQEIVSHLENVFELQDWQIYKADGPVNLSRLMHIYSGLNRPDLKFKPFSAREFQLSKKSKNIFDEVREHDVLLHHPFDSYKTIIGFIEGAAEDPNVLSIKQTLYRTNENSPIVEALVEAAREKEVAVVVEVKARFDEAVNIRWARHMEDAGIQVFHGLVGLKTHCKLTLIARKEPEGIRHYAHLGTGNYNPTTAQFYTDLSLLTADPELTQPIHDVFNFLTAYAEYPTYDPLLVAPLDLADRVLQLIAREAQHARDGRPARIVAKMNALLDKGVIQELYRASQAGVPIDLIVRGACALKPGIRGLSNRIRVRSIVGRFLEHSRIFYFENGGEEEIYLGSADWMPRNLYERVEILYPLKDSMLRYRVRHEILEAYLRDSAKARILQKNGNYVREHRRGRSSNVSTGFSAQQFLIDVAEGKRTFEDIPKAPASSRTRTVRSAG